MSIKKFLTVLLRLITPRSMRVCSFPGSLPSLLKNAMRNCRMRSTTRSERSRLTLIRIFSPKMRCPKVITAASTSLPNSTALTMSSNRAASPHSKPPSTCIKALMASTARSSTTAFTCAISDPTKVSIRVNISSHLYGSTKGSSFFNKPPTPIFEVEVSIYYHLSNSVQIYANSLTYTQVHGFYYSREL